MEQTGHFFYAVIILFYRLLNPLAMSLGEAMRVFMGFVFTLLIMILGWIPFRSESLDMILNMLLLTLKCEFCEAYHFVL